MCMGEGNKESVGEHCVMVGSCSTAVAAVRAKKQEDVERQTAVHVGSKRRGEKNWWRSHHISNSNQGPVSIMSEKCLSKFPKVPKYVTAQSRTCSNCNSFDTKRLCMWWRPQRVWGVWTEGERKCILERCQFFLVANVEQWHHRKCMHVLWPLWISSGIRSDCICFEVAKGRGCEMITEPRFMIFTNILVEDIHVFSLIVLTCW